MSCFGPGSHPGWPLRKAIQGPGVDHNQESLQDGVFTHRYESDPLLSDIHNVLVCIYMWQLCGRKRGRKVETDRERGSVGVQGRALPVVSHCRKAKLLPDLGIHPCTVQCYCSYPSRLLVLLSLSSHSSTHLQLFFFFFFFTHYFLTLCPSFGSCGSQSCWVA